MNKVIDINDSSTYPSFLIDSFINGYEIEYDKLFKDTNDNPSVQFPASDFPKEIIQYTTGSSSDADGKKATKNISLINPDEISYSNCTISVTPKYNGLYIEKAHNSLWDHVEIRIRDKTENRDNVWILTNQHNNSFNENK